MFPSKWSQDRIWRLQQLSVNNLRDEIIFFLALSEPKVLPVTKNHYLGCMVDITRRLEQFIHWMYVHQILKSSQLVHTPHESHPTPIWTSDKSSSWCARFSLFVGLPLPSFMHEVPNHTTKKKQLAMKEEISYGIPFESYTYLQRYHFHNSCPNFP